MTVKRNSQASQIKNTDVKIHRRSRTTNNQLIISNRSILQNQRSPLEIAKPQSIPQNEIRTYEKIAVGSNSSTFYRGDLNDHWKKGPVAIKLSNGYQSLKGHVGYCDTGTEHILVYEYADNGSLSTCLHKLTWAQRLKICIGAAEGLKYLHSGLGEYESVIHGEFTSHNILISDDLEAKICGLGSSFLVPRNHPDTKVYEKPVGRQEMDPVYRESYIPKVESNVYSLGVVLLEILTGKLVNTKCDGDEELSLMALVRRHYGDGFDKFIDPQIRDEIDVRSLHICKEIAYRCISYQIKDHPSLNKIIKRLEEALYIQKQKSWQRADGFGEVYKGQPLERWQNRTVAIKSLLPESYQGEYEFRNELKMIFSFSHENIIPFIGYCDEGREKIIVYEYASNGSLDCHLTDKNKRRFLTWERRLNICLGAARGLDYLHSGLGDDNRVIHRDVKSANILLDHNLVAKVCDFGLSKSGPTNQQHTQVYTNATGTNFYMDPIYHERGVLRKESDVYSFGVVMFELLSGMLAHHRRRIGDDKQKPLINLVRRYYDYRPDLLVDPEIKDEIDNRSFNAFRAVAFQCISYNSKERPTMEAIADRVEEALELQVTNKGKFKQKVTES